MTNLPFSLLSKGGRNSHEGDLGRGLPHLVSTVTANQFQVLFFRLSGHVSVSRHGETERGEGGM